MDTLTLLLLFIGLIHKASLELEVISENPTKFGNSPFWHAATNSLYYVDWFGVKFNIYRFDYFENRIYAASILNAPPNAAFIIPIEGYRNQFAVGFSDRTVKRIFWDGKSRTARILKIIFEVEQESHYNDNIWHVGTTDPFGRFYGGTMRKQLCSKSLAPDGAVYSYSPCSGLVKEIERIQISNGFAYSVRRRQAFHSDACDFVVKAYDWNVSSGRISNGKKLYQVHEGCAIPSRTALGLAIDVNDNLYVSLWNGSSIVKVDSRCVTAHLIKWRSALPDSVQPWGKQLKVFHLPCAFADNIAFGGPNLNELFVVTGQLAFDVYTGGYKSQELNPTAGHLHIIRDVGATGYAGKELKLDL